MAVEKRGEFYYGDNAADIQEFLTVYSGMSYPASYFKQAICQCGNSLFSLRVDDREGVAIRVCNTCGDEHPIGDSEEYLEEAELEESECPCGNTIFEITAGVALYQNSKDVKWLYLGCRCPECNLVACYADWKNEYEGYRQLLEHL